MFDKEEIALSWQDQNMTSKGEDGLSLLEQAGLASRRGRAGDPTLLERSEKKAKK